MSLSFTDNTKFNSSSGTDSKGSEGCSRFTSEFQCAMMSLSPDTPRGRVDWMKAFGYSGIIISPSILLLCRFASSLAAFGLMINSLISFWQDGMWFAYMTHWIMIVNTIFLVLESIATFYIQSLPVERSGEGVTKDMPTFIKIVWCLQSAGLVTSMVLTGLFWELLAEENEDFFDIYAHGGLLFLVFVEYMINGAPYHMAHAIYPFILSSLYTIWNGIFWAAGLRIKGHPWIYETICWCVDKTRSPYSPENPYNGTATPEVTAALTLGVPFIAVPILTLLTFAVGLPFRKVALVQSSQSQNGGMLAFGA